MFNTLDDPEIIWERVLTAPLPCQHHSVEGQLKKKIKVQSQNTREKEIKT